MMAERQLGLVVRFSTSDPDVILSIKSPTATSGLGLRQLVRAQLQPPSSTRRLRLIHAGKVIPDNASLSHSLNPPNPPPGRDDGQATSAKAKGKRPLPETGPPAARLYIHCSIGDALSPADLAAEAEAAQHADESLRSKSAQAPAAPAIGGDSAPTTTTPAPRGFDRLLSAGFSTPEVAALRAQFMAIQAHNHTPDTMPTGEELLAMEERWLESGSSPIGGGGGDESGGGGFEDSGGLEDMLYGNLIGFFWPIGAMCWLMREEGVWSRRRQIAVLSGFLVNITFGFLRIMN